jgi:two-component SAPR family response regulator
MKVIVIEDDLLSLEQLELVLKKNKFTSVVHGFSIVDESLAYLYNNQADVVFIGMSLVVESGFSFLAEILKGLNKFLMIVFILNPIEKSVNKAVAKSGFDFIVKPVTSANVEKMMSQASLDLASGKHRKKHEILLEKIC